MPPLVIVTHTWTIKFIKSLYDVGNWLVILKNIVHLCGGPYLGNSWLTLLIFYLPDYKKNSLSKWQILIRNNQITFWSTVCADLKFSFLLVLRTSSWHAIISLYGIPGYDNVYDDDRFYGPYIVDIHVLSAVG